MLYFSSVKFTRTIVHQIAAKVPGEVAATAQPSSQLVELDESTSQLIRNRLTSAFGRNTKSFQVTVEDSGEFSAYQHAKLCMNSNDEFIKHSESLCMLAAKAQTRSNIPGGYFLCLEAEDNMIKMLIIIKAEPHEAMTYVSSAKSASVNTVKKVFFSPAQKLFKICVFKSIDKKNADDEIWLYDDSFRSGGLPAEYFYKDFLGLNPSSNSKIKTAKFVDDVLDYMNDSGAKIDDQIKVKRALVTELQSNSGLLNPTKFRDKHIPAKLKDDYSTIILHEHPNAFAKDSSLTNRQLAKDTLKFDSNIKLNGSSENLSEHVETVYDPASYDWSQVSSDQTVVIIDGKPALR